MVRNTLTLAGAFEAPYFLQETSRDECFYGGYAKLRNAETTAIHPQNYWTNPCEGIGIDIFPLDATFENPRKEVQKQRRIHRLQRFLYANVYGYFKEFKDMPMLVWKGYKYAGKLTTRAKLLERLKARMTAGDAESRRLAIYCHYGADAATAVRYLERDAFEETFSLSYEGVKMAVPAGWDALLRGLYGENYAEGEAYQPEKRRHGFYDVDTPYPVYKKRFGGLKNPGSISEKIIFVGDEALFPKCLPYYQGKVEIAYFAKMQGDMIQHGCYTAGSGAESSGFQGSTEEHDVHGLAGKSGKVDMSGATAAHQISGIPVLSWTEFLALEKPEDAYRIIILACDVRAAEEKLQAAGIANYYIYWYNREWMLYANVAQIWREV